jgi:hypothetical protein
VKYLRADFSELYRSEEWQQWLYYALGCVVAYPLGIPLFFFVIICRNRARLLWPATRIRLGLLYAAYHDRRWWFETLDMLNKLFLSAAIVFVPAEYSIRVAMLWAGLYMILTLTLNPYIRKGDDRFAMLCQVETFLIMMSAQLLSGFNENTFDTAADNLLTIFDLSFSGLVIWLFIVQTGRNLKKILVMSKEARQKQLDESEFSGDDEENPEDEPNNFANAVDEADNTEIEMGAADDAAGEAENTMGVGGDTETGATQTSDDAQEVESEPQVFDDDDV